jgi:hypothetical protein
MDIEWRSFKGDSEEIIRNKKLSILDLRLKLKIVEDEKALKKMFKVNETASEGSLFNP